MKRKTHAAKHAHIACSLESRKHHHTIPPHHTHGKPQHTHSRGSGCSLRWCRTHIALFPLNLCSSLLFSLRRVRSVLCRSFAFAHIHANRLHLKPSLSLYISRKTLAASVSRRPSFFPSLSSRVFPLLCKVCSCKTGLSLLLFFFLSSVFSPLFSPLSFLSSVFSILFSQSHAGASPLSTFALKTLP